MAAAGLGRCVLNGVRASSRLALPARGRISHSRPWLPTRCCVALTARGFSSNEGLFHTDTSDQWMVKFVFSFSGSDRRYAKSHEWVTLDGATATVGISDYAQVSGKKDLPFW